LQHKIKRDLTSGSISKNLWFLAFPMMATNALQTMFNIIDMVFVGKLGPSSIAAVTVVGIIMMIPFSLILGTSIGTIAMVSRFYGAEDYKGASHVAYQTIVTAIVGGAIVTILGVLFAPLLINLFGVASDVHLYATLYLRIIFIASIPVAIQFLTAAIFQAIGDAPTAMWINLIAVLLNILLDPFLIFGIGPFPRLEVAGAAWATSIARTVGMAIALYWLFHKQTQLKIKWEGIKPDGEILRRLFKIGVPSSLQMTMRSASGIVMMGIVAGFGTFSLAAYGIGIRIDMLVMMPGFGLAAAAATLVGQNLGADKPDRAVQSSWLAAIYYVIIMVSTGIVYYILAPKIFSIFNTDPSVISNGNIYIRTIVLSYPFLAIAIIFNRAISGAGETVITMIITGLSLFGIAVPLAFAIPHFFQNGVKGVWIAIVVSNIVQALWVTIIFLRGKWKQKRI
jgi:putative MATE family efflux protein